MRKEGAVPGAPVQAVPPSAVSAAEPVPATPTAELPTTPRPATHGTPASPALPFALNERYVLENELGRGGMGRVFAARDSRIGRRVAIKFLAQGMRDDDELRRFEQEARAAGSLNHPNVLIVHDIGMHQGEPFIVSEFLEGGTLRERLEGTPLDLSEAIDYAVQLADGLAAAHDRGIVHRDLKPENLFITNDGRLKILDFGIAKLVAPESKSPDLKQSAQTQTGAILGTMGYMSPEQVRGQPADRRSDIFTAGAILYEMLSGSRAFKATSLVETAYAILNEDPPELPEQVPEALQEVVWRCLEKKPEERLQSASELAPHLKRLSALPRASREPTLRALDPGARLRKIRWPFAVAGGLVLSLALLVALNIGGWRGRVLGITKRASQGAGVSAAPSRTRPSFAVLGFKNLSGRPDQAWLSTALSEMLTTELAAGEKLRTIPGENVGRMKVELALKDAETLGTDSLVRVRKNLGADLVVVGAYVGLGKEAGGQFRLDVRLQDALAGETIAAFAEAGTENDLFDLVSRTGAKLRKKLGVGEISTTEAAAVRASLPAAPDAARLYSEGLAKLRVFDALEARNLLEKALAADPDHALAHSALSVAWSSLRYDDKAQEEAKKAFDLSATLSREERLGVEGRYRETTHEWNKAVDIYRTLWDFFPDNVEYGLQLANAQISAGKEEEARVTVQRLWQLPESARDNGRIHLVEAARYRSSGSFKEQQAAAAKASAEGKAQGRQLLVAAARYAEALALMYLGENRESRVAVDEARQIWESVGDRGKLNLSSNIVAILAYREGDIAESMKVFRDVLRTARGIGDRTQAASALNNLALAVGDRGDFRAARRMFQELISINQESGDRAEEALAQHNLASVIWDEGDLSRALEIERQALAKFREVGRKDRIAMVQNFVGLLFLQQGDLVAARRTTEEALAAALGRGEKINVAFGRLVLGWIGIEEGRWSEVEMLAQKAVEDCRREKVADLETYGRGILARSLQEQSKLSDAKTQVDEARAISEKLRNPRIHFYVGITAARLKAALGDRDGGRSDLERIVQDSLKAGLVVFQFEARSALAEVMMKSGDVARARSLLVKLEKDARQKGFRLIARKAALARRRAATLGASP